MMERVDTEPERVVAVLHDVTEDSPCELDDINRIFGPDIRDAGDVLTKRDGESYEESIERVSATRLLDPSRLPILKTTWI